MTALAGAAEGFSPFVWSIGCPKMLYVPCGRGIGVAIAHAALTFCEKRRTHNPLTRNHHSSPEMDDRPTVHSPRFLSGGSWAPAPAVAEIAGVTVPTVLAWKRKGTIFAISFDGKYWYPKYAVADRKRPIPELAKVIKVLHEYSDLAKAAWFDSPSSFLNAARLRELLSSVRSVPDWRRYVRDSGGHDHLRRTKDAALPVRVNARPRSDSLTLADAAQARPGPVLMTSGAPQTALGMIGAAFNQEQEQVCACTTTQSASSSLGAAFSLRRT